MFDWMFDEDENDEITEDDIWEDETFWDDNDHISSIPQVRIAIRDRSN